MAAAFGVGSGDPGDGGGVEGFVDLSASATVAAVQSTIANAALVPNRVEPLPWAMMSAATRSPTPTRALSARPPQLPEPSTVTSSV